MHFAPKMIRTSKKGLKIGHFGAFLRQTGCPKSLDQILEKAGRFLALKMPNSARTGRARPVCRGFIDTVVFFGGVK